MILILIVRAQILAMLRASTKDRHEYAYGFKTIARAAADSSDNLARDLIDAWFPDRMPSKLAEHSKKKTIVRDAGAHLPRPRRRCRPHLRRQDLEHVPQKQEPRAPLGDAETKKQEPPRSISPKSSLNAQKSALTHRLDKPPRQKTDWPNELPPENFDF